MAALMEIIIKGVDQASQVASKISGTFQGAADKINSAHQKASQSTDKLSQSYQKMSSTGMSSYAQLSAKEQQHYQNLSKTKAIIEHLGSSGTRMGGLISSGAETASAAVTRINSTVTRLKSQLESTSIGSHLVSGLDAAHNKVSSFTSKLSSITSKASEVGTKIGSAIGKGLDSAKTKVDSLNEKLGIMGQVITSAVGAIGMGGIYQLTVGLGMAREQMLTLMSATTGSAAEAQKLVNQLDKITNKSVVGLSELGNAMNNIKISTGMTNSQLSLIAPTVDKVGQAAILMGKDTTTAKEIMTASFRGLNGEFEILKANFGITKQTLLDAGWSGAANDVEGYNAALTKVLDKNLNLDGVMDSTTGKIEKIKKAFRTAGKTIGEQVVPYIEKAAEWFLSITQQFPGLTTGLIAIAAGFMLFLTALPVLGSVIGSLKALAIFLGIVKTEENALTLAQVRQQVATAASTIWAYAQAAAYAVLGVAAKLYAIIMMEASIATKAVMIAQMLLNAVMSMNPVMLVVIAIMALVAILWHLYNTNEGVRNAINWLWVGLQQLGGYIYGGLIAAWNALSGVLGWVWGILVQVGSFIIGTLLGAWNAFANAVSPITRALGLLWTALQKVFGGWLSGKAGETNVILQALAWAFGIVYTAVSQFANILGAYLAPYIERLMAGLRILWSFMGGAFSEVWKTVGGIIVAFISYIATFIKLLADLIEGNITATEFMSEVWIAFQQLFDEVFASIINGVGVFAFKVVNYMIKAASGMLNSFVQFLPQIPGKIAYFLGFALGKFISFNMNLMNILLQFGIQLITWIISTGINFILALSAWLAQLPGLIWTWLIAVITYVINWASIMVTYGISTASNFVNAIIAWISSLPGRVWSFLMAVISHVASWAGSLPGYASRAGSNLVNGFINAITSLPGQVYSVLMQVYHRLTSVGGQMYSAAVSLGSQIWEGFKAGLGIHSPSYLEKAMDAIIDKAFEMPVEMKAVKNDLAGIDWRQAEPEIDGSVKAKASTGASNEKNLAEVEVTVKHVFDFKNLKEVSSVLTKEELISVLKTITYDLEWIDTLVKTLTNAKNITKMNLG